MPKDLVAPPPVHESWSGQPKGQAMNVLCDLHVKKVFQLQLCDVFSNQGNWNTTLYKQNNYVLYVINHHFALLQTYNV